MQDIADPLSALKTRVLAIGVALTIAVGSQVVAAQEKTEPAQPEAAPTGAKEAEPAPEEPAPTGEEQPEAAQAKPAPGGTAPVPFDMEAWAKKHRKYNTWKGSTGGIRVLDPDSGAPGSVRFQLLFHGFASQDFLNERDEVQQLGQGLSLSWTPIDVMEVFGSFGSQGTESTFIDLNKRGHEYRRKQTFHVFANTLLGAKVGGEVAPLLSLGGDFTFLLPNTGTSLWPGFNGLSVRLGASAKTDLRNLEDPVPLIFRFNMSYLFDQSAELIEKTEKTRYDNLSDRLARKYEIRNLITRLERFALNINRMDMFSLGLGIEVPMIRLADSFFVHPMAEWNIGIPANRRGYKCVSYRTKDGKAVQPSDKPKDYKDDLCLLDEGGAAIPMTLDMGVRIVTPARGLTGLAGASIGLTGTSSFVRELAPTAPYQLFGAVSYDYDARPPEADVKIIEHLVQLPPPPPPPKGRVLGLVVVEGTNTPVAGASIRISGSELSPLASREDGHFVTYKLDPGAVQMDIAHPEFQPGQCSATIGPDGGDVNIDCVLTPLPPEAPIKGRVLGSSNEPVANAKVELSGPASYSFTTDQDGKFDQRLAPGQYSARIEADGYLIRTDSFTVAPRVPASVDMVLVAKPKVSKISLKGDSIRLGTNLTFAKGSSQISREGVNVLAELADFLQRNPKLRLVKIAGPTDAGAKDTGVAFNRAVVIKQQLVADGVPADRIDAVAGEGPRVKITVEQKE